MHWKNISSTYQKHFLGRENALEDFSGTILFVSHDRFFINKFADKIISFDDKNIQTYYGNYDYYVEKKDELVYQKKR